MDDDLKPPGLRTLQREVLESFRLLARPPGSAPSLGVP